AVDVHGHARIFGGIPFDDGWKQRGDRRLVRADSHFADRRVGQEFDVPHALLEFVEAMLRRSNTSAYIVGVMPLALRSSRGTRRICSRFAMASETAGCDMASRRAPFAMLPASTTVDRMKRSRIRRRRPSRLSHSIVTAIGAPYMASARFRLPPFSRPF